MNAVVASSSRVLAPSPTTADSTTSRSGKSTSSVVELVAGGLRLDVDSPDAVPGEVADAVGRIVSDRLAIRLGSAASLDATMNGEPEVVNAVVAFGIGVFAVAGKTAERLGGDVDQVALLKTAVGQLVVGSGSNGYG
ncbi:hypothetical protein DER46DRAFT_579770 [Fusarium sp. MPI-SDFR-AT-0072]|nr:hypothetical protein DER46DRAFT_579770 [Fusarium sp. MPI-SDFR-AT-0072]